MRLLGGKKKLPWYKNAVSLLWPKKGFSRLLNYFLHRIGRLKASPYNIAAGFACGIAVSFTPFIGLHILLGIALAWLMRGNILAGIIGTFIGGNPWTFPFIWLVTYHSGIYFLDGNTAAQSPLELLAYEENLWMLLGSLLANLEILLIPMLVGALPFVIFSWIGSFSVCYLAVFKYKTAAENRRRRQIEAKIVAAKESANKESAHKESEREEI